MLEHTNEASTICYLERHDSDISWETSFRHSESTKPLPKQTNTFEKISYFRGQAITTAPPLIRKAALQKFWGNRRPSKQPSFTIRTLFCYCCASLSFIRNRYELENYRAETICMCTETVTFQGNWKAVVLLQRLLQLCRGVRAWANSGQRK